MLEPKSLMFASLMLVSDIMVFVTDILMLLLQRNTFLFVFEIESKLLMIVS